MENGDILGHENMGEVIELGSEVTNLKIGDRVGSIHYQLRSMLVLSKRSVFVLRPHQSERRNGGQSYGTIARRAVRF